MVEWMKVFVKGNFVSSLLFCARRLCSPNLVRSCREVSPMHYLRQCLHSIKLMTLLVELSRSDFSFVRATKIFNDTKKVNAKKCTYLVLTDTKVLPQGNARE